MLNLSSTAWFVLENQVDLRLHSVAKNIVLITFIFINNDMIIIFNNGESDIPKPQHSWKHFKRLLLVFLADIHDIHGTLQDKIPTTELNAESPMKT